MDYKQDSKDNDIAAILYNRKFVNNDIINEF